MQTASRHILISNSLQLVIKRVDAEMLREVAWPVDQRPLAFICGPTPFVEIAAASFVAPGHEPARVQTERFGPTGEA